MKNYVLMCCLIPYTKGRHTYMYKFNNKGNKTYIQVYIANDIENIREYISIEWLFVLAAR